METPEWGAPILLRAYPLFLARQRWLKRNLELLDRELRPQPEPKELPPSSSPSTS
jgi:hypothetical protein